MPKWEQALPRKKLYSGWRLVGKNACSCCPNGVKFGFDIKFTDANPHATVSADMQAVWPSDVVTWHLGDLRFSLPHYPGVAHEVGHLFGLEDEYPPQANPPPADWKDSLMGNAANYAKLMLRHKTAITKSAKIDDHLPGGPYEVQE